MSNYHKNIENNPLFQTEPFSKREAYLWIITNAEKDSFSTTGSLLSTKWKWHISKVMRFLVKLQEESLINKSIRSGKLYITLKEQNNSKSYSNQDQIENKSVILQASTSLENTQETPSNKDRTNYDLSTVCKTENSLNLNKKQITKSNKL